MSRLLLTLAVLVSVAAPAFALKCYVCAGTENTCKKSKLEESKGTFLHTCILGDKCIRSWSKSKDDDAVVASGCAYQSVCDDQKSACDKLKDTLKDYHCAVGCCSEDGCNASSYFTSNIILLAVCFVLGLALLK